MSDKPTFLVLGGTGFVGRHLVKYLVDNNLASKIRVADKQLPQTSYFSPEFEQAFKQPTVEFKQANLVNQGHLNRVFDAEVPWDYVINLAAETKFGQSPEVYQQMVHQLSVACGNEAAKRGVKKFIEVSTAQVYDADKKASKESDKLKPWTMLAENKAKAEEDLKKIPGLPLIIVRPATIYGPGDINGLAPRIIVAATYTHTKDKMKLLWSGDLRVNTVHVSDVARALHHLCLNGQPGQVFNLADKNDTNQKKINEILDSVFGIESDFLGTIISNLAKLNMSAAVDTANDQHMAPWSDMCKEHNIQFTPLSPYIDKELLYNNSLSVDGTAIESTGFQYQVPTLTKNLILEEIHYFIQLKLFPQIC